MASRDQSVLKPHAIPDGVQVTLKIQNKVVPPDSPPQLFILPSGDITPFTMLLGKPSGATYYKIIGKANGEVNAE